MTTAAPERTTVQIDGSAVAYRRAGRGTPILFLHGSEALFDWLPFMERLAERFDLIVPDHPGFGASEIPDWLDNIHDLAYFYRDFIEALGLGDVHVIGNGLGGWIGCEMAVRQSLGLRSLTLIDPAGLRVRGVQKADPFLMNPEKFVRSLFADQRFADALLDAPETDAAQMMQIKNKYVAARLGWQPRNYDPHLHKWMHRIRIPALIVWGEDDAMIPAAYADEFRRLIPSARVQLVAGAGHLPHVEQPDAVLAAVLPFLDRSAT